MGHRRKVMHRLDAGVFLLGVLLWKGFVVSLWANWPMPTDLWVSVASHA